MLEATIHGSRGSPPHHAEKRAQLRHQEVTAFTAADVNIMQPSAPSSYTL
ncbi:hypothetical protein [Arthrobacter methylotrophus]